MKYARTIAVGLLLLSTALDLPAQVQPCLGSGAGRFPFQEVPLTARLGLLTSYTWTGSHGAEIGLAKSAGGFNFQRSSSPTASLSTALLFRPAGLVASPNLATSTARRSWAGSSAWQT